MISSELTPAEIWLLNRMYELDETDIYGILDHIGDEKEWKYTTIQTMIHHMCNKGFVERNKDGRRFLYKPSQSRSKMIEVVLDRLFGKSMKEDPSPITDYLVNLKKLKPRDKKTLENIFGSGKKTK